MDDLISRKAAMKLIESESRMWGEEYGVIDVLHDLEDFPSAEPQRIKGKWNTYYHGGTDFSYSCARCGYGAPFDMSGGKVFQKKWNYCPNCGADMKGEQNE